MNELSATEAGRGFSGLLDAVEHRGDSFLISRNGRAVAVVSPALPKTGKSLKDFLREHPPDDSWAKDLRETREMVLVEDRHWPA